MAEGSAHVVGVEDDRTESFHDVDVEGVTPVREEINTSPMSLLLKINQLDKWPLPTGVITNRSMMELVKRVTGVILIDVTFMNEYDSVVEFARGTRLYEVAQLQHSLNTIDNNKVEVGCLISTKPQLVDMVKAREEMRWKVVHSERINRSVSTKKNRFRLIIVFSSYRSRSYLASLNTKCNKLKRLVVSLLFFQDHLHHKT